MEYKKLTKKFNIPSIGIGTWTIGGSMEKDFTNDSKEIQTIKDAIRLGYTHIDTAELYGNGHCEELIGEAMKDFDREKLIIASKVFKTNLKYNDVITACKNSLKRLQTTYIDIFMIHSPNRTIPIEETMKAMDFLVEKKLIRFIGVSNFSVENIKEAQGYSKNKIVVNQIPYNLKIRNKDPSSGCTNMESEIIPYCQKNNIIVTAYRPLERRFLLKSNAVLDSLAKKYNKTKAQIAINWLISKKNIITIPKSSNIKHLKENLGSIGWKLNDEDIKLLDETNF